MTADELRRRVEALGLTQREMAGRLGLSLNGLFKQLAGERKVSRQTELLLECVEKHQPRRVTTNVAIHKIRVSPTKRELLRLKEQTARQGAKARP
jgi:transcriptional regulator with XRE-family HTH domain